MTEINNLADLTLNAKRISNRQDFEDFCNKREFEDQVNDLVARVNLTEELKVAAEDYIEKNHEQENALCFVLFFTLYTVFRKSKTGNIYDFTKDHKDKFCDYEFFKFIELLAEYATFKDDKTQFKVIRKSKSLTDGATFNNHNGVINLYVEAVCSYFEANLDEREDQKPYIEDAKEKISAVINGGENKYPKFHLNLGRLEALLSNYSVAENRIREAIGYIGYGNTRVYTVHEYEQYLTKVNMIKLYDQNDEKIKEVEKIKTDNLKSMSIITALLAFILGAINVFSEVKEPQILVKLMVAYFGLVVVLLGILLLGIRVIYKEKKNKFLTYSWAVLVAGIIVFAAAIALIW